MSPKARKFLELLAVRPLVVGDSRAQQRAYPVQELQALGFAEIVAPVVQGSRWAITPEGAAALAG